KENIKAQVDRVKLKKHQLTFDGRLFTAHSQLISTKVLFWGRHTKRKAEMPISFEPLQKDIEKKYGFQRYHYKVKMDLNKLFNEIYLEEDVYDLFFKMELHDQKEFVVYRI